MTESILIFALRVCGTIQRLGSVRCESNHLTVFTRSPGIILRLSAVLGFHSQSLSHLHISSKDRKRKCFSRPSIHISNSSKFTVSVLLLLTEQTDIRCLP